MKLRQLSGATVLRPDITVKKKNSARSGCIKPRAKSVEPTPHSAPKTSGAPRRSSEDGIPVFKSDQGDELTYFLETGFTTVPRIEFPPLRQPFVKDGVLVDPQGDAVNGSLGYKATECGCLYRATSCTDGYWFHAKIEPDHIVWLKAWPDWQERHERMDWSAQDTDKPEVAPWLGKGAL